MTGELIQVFFGHREGPLSVATMRVPLPRPFLGPHGQSPAQLDGRLMEELLHAANMRPKTREVKP